MNNDCCICFTRQIALTKDNSSGHLSTSKNDMFNIFKLPEEFRAPQSLCVQCSEKLYLSYTFFNQIIQWVEQRKISLVTASKLTDSPIDNCPNNLDNDSVSKLQSPLKLVHG
ncbi:uncharacterized protein LOC131433060 isoform X2 [Malaya genurostris]|nr:uncharacterized protein LOC131433060 isoform X2 [Malaya genurostris]